MGADSKIEWTDHTFNPWVGCAKVSPACTNCYAEGWAKRTGQAGLWRGERRRTSAQNWREPLKWNRETPGAKVFCASLADVFEAGDELDDWRLDLFDLISRTPDLTWLLLTKRPENAARWFKHPDMVLPNVWLGTTVEDQQRADERIPHLLRCPARVRFLSCEPLLGPINLRALLLSGGGSAVPTPRVVADALTGKVYAELERSKWHEWGSPSFDGGVSWVICGGESGPRARPSHPGWFRALRDQCVSAGVPFFFKQHGDLLPACQATDDAQKVRPVEHPSPHTPGRVNTYYRPGKALAGALLDGQRWAQFPGGGR